MQSLCVQFLSHRCSLHSPSHRIWRGRTARHKQEVTISHHTHASTDEQSVRRWCFFFHNLFFPPKQSYLMCGLSAVWYVAGEDLELVDPGLQIQFNADHYIQEHRWTQSETDHRTVSKVIFTWFIREQMSQAAYLQKHTCRLHGFAPDHNLHGRGDQNPHGAVLWD